MIGRFSQLVKRLGKVFKDKRGAIKAYTKQEKQEKNAQVYEPWTAEQDDQLEVLYTEGTKVNELADILERSSGPFVLA